MSPNMQVFVETILSRLAETEDLTLLHPKSTWQIYEATVKEGKHEPPGVYPRLLGPGSVAYRFFATHS